MLSTIPVDIGATAKSVLCLNRILAIRMRPMNCKAIIDFAILTRGITLRKGARHSGCQRCFARRLYKMQLAEYS